MGVKNTAVKHKGLPTYSQAVFYGLCH